MALEVLHNHNQCAVMFPGTQPVSVSAAQTIPTQLTALAFLKTIVPTFLTYVFM